MASRTTKTTVSSSGCPYPPRSLSGYRPMEIANHPTKLDHFVFLRKKKSANRLPWEADPELTLHYGEQCRDLHIMLIDDDIENVFPSSYAWWTATERKCWGDGTSATGTGVICETWALEAAVIPAKAGIDSANLRKCAVEGLDSRFRGNDQRFERDPIPSDTTTPAHGCEAWRTALDPVRQWLSGACRRAVQTGWRPTFCAGGLPPAGERLPHPHVFLPIHSPDSLRSAGVIWSAVIPAKAGIYSANLRKCAADKLDSRFRGNDRRLESIPIPNDISTHSALQEIQTFTGGRLAGITAKLTVRPEEATYFDRKENRKKTSSIWALSLAGCGKTLPCCHSERSEESPQLKAQSVRKNAEMLRCAQHDRPESRMKPDSHRVRSANRFSNSLRRLETVP